MSTLTNIVLADRTLTPILKNGRIVEWKHMDPPYDSHRMTVSASTRERNERTGVRKATIVMELPIPENVVGSDPEGYAPGPSTAGFIQIRLEALVPETASQTNVDGAYHLFKEILDDAASSSVVAKGITPL